MTARLERKGYTVTDDFFDFVYNADRTPPLLTVQGGNDYVDGNDFALMAFSPNGDVTRPVVLATSTTRRWIRCPTPRRTPR